MDDALLEENEIRISPSMNEDLDDLEEDHNLRDPRFLTTCYLVSKIFFQVPIILGDFHNDHDDHHLHGHRHHPLLGVHPLWLRNLPLLTSTQPKCCQNLLVLHLLCGGCFAKWNYFLHS